MEQKKASSKDLIHGDRPVLVDLFATWCGPCKAMSPIIDAFKQDIGDKAVVLKVDIDRDPAAAAAYRVQGVPTPVIFNEGKAVWRKSGVIPASELNSAIRPFLR